MFLTPKELQKLQYEKTIFMVKKIITDSLEKCQSTDIYLGTIDEDLSWVFDLKINGKSLRDELKEYGWVITQRFKLKWSWWRFKYIQIEDKGWFQLLPL